MLHSKSKIAHMKAGRLIGSVDEPMRICAEENAVIFYAREDYLFDRKPTRGGFFVGAWKTAYAAAWYTELADERTAR